MDSWVAVAGLVFFVVGVAGALLPGVSVLRQQLRARRRGRPAAVEDSPVRELAEGVAAGLRGEPERPGEPARPETEFTARQLQLYADYHDRARREGWLSYQLGVVAAGLGFMVILASVAVLVFQGGDTAWLGAVSGAVCEAVAALYLAETRSTREREARMFDQLNAEVVRAVNTMRATEMARQLTDVGEREQLLAAIALKLLEAAPAVPPPAPPPADPAAP